MNGSSFDSGSVNLHMLSDNVRVAYLDKTVKNNVVIDFIKIVNCDKKNVLELQKQQEKERNFLVFSGNKAILNENLKDKINFLKTLKILEADGSESNFSFENKEVIYLNDFQMSNLIRLIFSKIAKQDLKASEEKQNSFKKDYKISYEPNDNDLPAKRVAGYINGKIKKMMNLELIDERYKAHLKQREEKNLKIELLDEETKQFYKRKNIRETNKRSNSSVGN